MKNSKKIKNSTHRNKMKKKDITKLYQKLEKIHQRIKKEA